MPDAEARELIAGRYLVEEKVASGAMGEVLAVLDRSTGRRIALKRLLPTRDPRLHGMFEREYRTLADLEHPSIIDVFEYGVDGVRPYYTMELLDGQDLRKLAPLGFERVCRYLRDVASALALLHARRLLHRDLSPRNVRVTSDDRVKLLDFGAMTSFGVCDVVVGTPPFLAPESLRRAALDQRADLYALGALAYWLLTKRHAFAARTLAELPERWRQAPPAPSKVLASAAQERGAPAGVLAGVPAALDQLILSLLSPDPLARPSSAAEVVDRLSAIAGLPAPPHAPDALSYLHRAPTVGRESETVRLSGRLERALRGHGSCTLVAGPSGAGSTRLLEDLCLRAQLAGAPTVSVSAAAERGPHAVTHAIVEQLLAALPELCVQAAGDHAPLLARFSAPLGERLAVKAPARASGPGALPPGELRSRTQSALHDWLLALAALRPLVIAIDDVQHLDHGSASLLSALARTARGHGLMLLLAHKTDEPASDPAAAHLIATASRVLELPQLERFDVHELVRATFGDAEHAPRLAEWLHGLSGGSPKACMELLRDLVEREVIRFDRGLWLLPKELNAAALPASLPQILEARLSRLGDASRRLCEAISAQRSWLGIDLCLSLARDEGIEDGQQALAELVRASVIVQRGSAFRLADEHVRARIYDGMTAARRTALHRRLGELLRARDASDLEARIDAGFHLLRGGDERAGAELLAQAGTELTHRADELPTAVPALSAALEVFERLGYGPARMSSLLSALALAGYRVDRKYAARYGERAITVFEGLVGLTLAARLRPYLGARLSLWLGLGSGALRAIARYGVRGPQHYERLIEDLIVCVLSLVGTSALCLSHERAARYAAALEPFVALGSDHVGALAYDFARTLSLTAVDRVIEVEEGCERGLALLANPTPSIRRVPAESLALLRGGVLFAFGVAEGVRGTRPVLDIADQVEAVGLELYAMAADQIRAQYHALRGDSARVAELAARIELRALQAGTSWQVEMWAPAARLHAHALSRDVLGVRGNLAELAKLAAEEPGFRPFELFARAVYLSMTGDAEPALEAFRALAALPPRSCMAWPAMMGEYANHAIDMGLYEEAREVTERTFAGSSAREHAIITMYMRLFIARARLAAVDGDPERASRLLGDLIAEHAAGANPLVLGDLWSARAHLALGAGDRAAAQRAADQVERWFRSTGNPALIAQCEQLQRSLLPDVEVPPAGKRPSPLPPTRITAPASTTSSTASSSTSSSVDPFDDLDGLTVRD